MLTFLLSSFSSFARTLPVTNGNDNGRGSLRQALAEARDGDVIQLAGVKLVTLTSGYLNIQKSVTIRGNGATLRADFSPMMKVSEDAAVIWERFHFEVQTASFSQLAFPTQAKLSFEASTGQWEKLTSTDILSTKSGYIGNVEQILPEEDGDIKPSTVICLDCEGGGGGGGGGGGCGSSSIAPTTITGTTIICQGSSTTLTVVDGALGTGAVIQWFAGSCGSTVISNNDAITVSPPVTTTYFVRFSGDCNTTGCASVTVTV